MTKNDIFEMVKNLLMEWVSEVDPSAIRPEVSLRDLGADSVERADLIIETMEALQLKVPLSEFGSLKNIQELVDFLHARIPVERM